MTNREKILQEGQKQINAVIDEYLEYCDKLNKEFECMCEESRERLKCLD
jgi:hypothetical protein